MEANESKLFVSEVDLETLTGTPRRERQFAWLRENGIGVRRNLKGNPVVLVSELEFRARGETAKPATTTWVPRAMSGVGKSRIAN